METKCMSLPKIHNQLMGLEANKHYMVWSIQTEKIRIPFSKNGVRKGTSKVCNSRHERRAMHPKVLGHADVAFHVEPKC
jgi:hypothetical protein